MAVPQLSVEPIRLAAGDTVSFVRGFADYLPANGWLLKYELRGGAQPIELVSTAQGSSHAILVTAAITATWLPGPYIMEGYAENAGTGERQRIYFNNLAITPNVETLPGDADVKTHWQKMLTMLEAVMLGKAQHDILGSDVDLTRIQRMTPAQLTEFYDYCLFRRQEEIARDNVRAGRSNGRNRLIQFVDPAGGGVGQFGAAPIFPEPLQ